ncbi:MAG: DUF2156 domain-containing protein, partial [Candidatus Lokiarchaeota archaeon]|nr:DUF2156 domain-containing protein [Candidatus Lokiarchaeota archaeon]
IFNKYFKKYPPEISEFTFTNLFAWQEYYQFLFLEWNEHLIIFSKNFLKTWRTPKSNLENRLYFWPPIGEKPENIIISLFEIIKNLEIHRVPESIINKLKEKKKYNDLNLEIEEDRDNWDYIYKKENLINLSGNRYRSKRRYLERFLNKYDYEFHLISEEWLEKCKELQNKWCMINECQKHKDLEEEYKAIDRMIENYAELNYRGGILLVEDIPVGYTLGEILNNNTSVIHIEKAHTHYEGSYQAINKMFIENCCKEVDFINREQDLGIPGLRRAKQSYYPDHMISKSIIFKKPK